MNENQQISAHRLEAAQASGGTSCEPLYDLFQKLVRENKIRGNVLDFGAGKGMLARRLCKSAQFDSITCVDLMPAPDGIPDDIDWYSCDLNVPVSLPDCSFDVILSAEVIEHLENARAVAREWFRLLKPGGWLLFSTPNNESIRSILALIGRGHYSAFGKSSYPAHITALLRKDMERICSEAGFKIIEFRFTNHGMLPKSRRHSWQDLSARMFRGLRFSDNVLAVCKRPPEVRT